MAPRRRRDKPQRSSPPPPPPMPPGRRRRDYEPERNSPPRVSSERNRGDRRDQRYSWFPYPLPNGDEILVYKDKDGVLFTDHGGPTRPVEDVIREFRSDHSRDPPPPTVDESDSKRPEEDQQKATPSPGPSPAQYTKEYQQAATPDPAPSPSQYIQEDSPAPQQTPTPNPGPSPAQFWAGLLDKAFAEHKLEMAQRRKELLEATKLEESSITNASSSSSSLSQSPLSKELLDTTKVPDSSITDASSISLPQPTPLLKELFDTITLDKSCITSVSPSLLQSLLSGVPDPLALKLDKALMSSSFVSSLVPTGLFIKYFVRVDKEGFFHTYPDRGGPFKTLEKAQEAIDSHHVVQREMMCMDGLSDEERAIRNTLYWYHDGTRKHSAEAFASCTTRNSTWELLKALLDIHNEDNDLLGDRAYELKDIVSDNSCFDGKDCIYSSYSHFNLTMKTKGADPNNDIYFAEVTCMSGDYEAYVLTCFCMVKPDHNGECAVCEVEMEDIKHPTDDVYNHGRRNKFHVYRSRCHSRAHGIDLFEQLFAVRDEAWLVEEEARVRCMIKEGKDARSSKLEVDNIGDDMIKEGKEARRIKLEVDNRRDDHAKRDKYVVPARRKSVECHLSRVCI